MISIKGSDYYYYNHNYNKIVKSDWLSTTLISALIGQLIGQYAIISQILLKLRLIGNRTLCRPIRSVIILVIKQIGLPLRGRPILLITRMIRDRIGLHSVLLPLLIVVIIIIIIINITKLSNLIGYQLP